MGLRVNTNIASLGAQRNLFNSSAALSGNYARLASGLRIASAADDAAGLGISERMRADVARAVASRNAKDGVSLVQTAEGALSEVSDILGRMRELGMQSANGTLNTDRATLDTKFQQLISEIDRISRHRVQRRPLLDGTSTAIAIQIGIDGTTNDVINVSGADVSAATLGRQRVIGTMTDAPASSRRSTPRSTPSTPRGTLGAQQNRLESTLRSLANVRETTSAAESRIRVDVAMETADLTRNSILQQASAAILSQANAQPGDFALSLLGCSLASFGFP